MEKLGRQRRTRLLHRMGRPEEDPQCSKDCHISRDFHERESKSFGAMPGHVLDVSKKVIDIGDFIEFSIVDQSIIIVRISSSEIRAHDNICQHRGRA